MNSSHCQNPGTRSIRRRAAATLSLSLLVSFSLLPTAAQRKQKRITSLWTATSAEGSRVHIISDSPVSDYEGYTRGGRFYVKIPLADLPSARGSLLGRGFNDVQIQRYGDGIIISFRLQPGTTARVEQASNRLDIVFTTPAGARAAVYASTNAAAERIRAKRIANAAALSKSSPSSTSNPRSARKPPQPASRTTLRSEAEPGKSNNQSTASNASGNNPGQARASGSPEAIASSRPSEATPSASPAPDSSSSAPASPTSTPDMSGSSVSVSPAGTPVSQAAPASQETPSPDQSSTAANTANDWRSRAHYWKVWAELNWVPLLTGCLIGLALLVLLFFWRATKRTRKTEVGIAAGSTKALAPKGIASPAQSSDAGQRAASQNARSQGASSAPSQTHSSNVSPWATDKDAGEEQEREVIEL